jgi:hypothetical protein
MAKPSALKVFIERVDGVPEAVLTADQPQSFDAAETAR